MNEKIDELIKGMDFRLDSFEKLILKTQNKIKELKLMREIVKDVIENGFGAKETDKDLIVKIFEHYIVQELR